MLDNKIGEKLTQLELTSDVILLADVFEKCFKVAVKKYGNNLLKSVSLPGYTYQCALKYGDPEIQTLQGKDLILLIESISGGVISSVMGNRFIKSDDNKKFFLIRSN